MKTFSKAVLCLFSLTLVATYAAKSAAGALADKAAFAKADEQVKDKTDYQLKKCGSAVTVKYDTASFKTPESVKMSNRCAEYVSAITDLCEHKFKDMKAELMKQVKTINCRFDAGLNHATDKGNKFEKSGTTITASFNGDTANVHEEFMKFLEKNL
ncbi:MAG: hypothetical protein ACXVA9_13835 [Bdellovibrionales bacterium]